MTLNLEGSGRVLGQGLARAQEVMGPATLGQALAWTASSFTLLLLLWVTDDLQ